jgi:hypothetical protein
VSAETAAHVAQNGLPARPVNMVKKIGVFLQSAAGGIGSSAGN